MTLIARDRLQSDFYPTNWPKFTTADPARSALKRCGVTEFRADIYRWASRYRIAKSFQGVKLHPKAGIHPETEELLDGMLEAFLVYSAFEQFCTKVLLLKMNEDTDLKTLEAPHGPGAFLAKIRAADPAQTFVSFLAENLDDKPGARMKRFIDGGTVTFVFSGRRRATSLRTACSRRRRARRTRSKAPSSRR